MSLLKSTAIVSSMTLLSRVSGLVRDMIFTRLFGIGLGTDAFLIAFKIPNFLRRLFAEGAFSQAFVPVLTEYKNHKDQDEVSDLTAHVAGTLAGILFIVTLIVVVASPILVMVFAPGFIGQQEKLDLTAQMLRVTIPYILFISLTALAAGVLNSYGRFAIPAFTPVLLNLSLIACAVWLAPYMAEPIMALAWGVFIAGILQLAFQLPFVAKLGLLRRPRWGWKHSGVRRVIKLMLPGIFGSSVMQINLLFDVLIASFLVTGSVTWLYLADRMVELPLGIFGIALATVILPNLSEKHVQSDPDGFSHMLDWALRWVLVIGLPAAVGLAILASPILTTLFLYGDVTANDIHMASISLWAYAFGLLGFIMVKVLAPGYFARQDTKTPVRIAIIAMAVNMVCNVVFVVAMLKLDIAGAHAGLALATTVSAFVNASLLLRGLKKVGVYQRQTGWLKLFIQAGLAALAMALLLLGFMGTDVLWQASSVLERVGRLSGLISLAVITYFGLLWLLGWRFSTLKRPRGH